MVFVVCVPLVAVPPAMAQRPAQDAVVDLAAPATSTTAREDSAVIGGAVQGSVQGSVRGAVTPDTAPEAQVFVPPAEAPAMAHRWRWPLSPRPEVRHRFQRPSHAYGPGHRGVDLGARVGQSVLAVADGVVSHVGVIADRPTISITHADGLRSTYEPVASTLTIGMPVRAGAIVGQIDPAAGHCQPATCLHLGAIRGQTYLDPLTLLGGRRVRLLPMGP